MSNTNTNSVEFEVVPYPEEPETLPETVEEIQPEECAPKKKKTKGACRFFAFVLIAVSALALFLPVQVLKGFTPERTTLFACVTDLFNGGEASKLFDMLPVYTDATNVAGLLAGIAFYLLLAAIALAVVCGLLSLLSGNVALLRTAAFLLATGFITYTVCGYTLPNAKETSIGVDAAMISLSAASTYLYLVLSFAKKGAKTFAEIFQLLFTHTFVAATVSALTEYTTQITDSVTKIGLTSDLAIQVIAAVIWVATFVGFARISTKKGLALDLLRYLLQLAVGAILCLAAFTTKVKGGDLLLYAIVAVAVSLLQIFIWFKQGKSGKAASEDVMDDEDEMEEEIIPVAEPIEECVPEYTVEEYAEALPYDGGPVEGVEIAQEVNPTFEERPINAPNHVNTSGYDFYNSKSFDPFIAILNTEERNQFTELFILKYKGPMPEIPDYEVGGNNKEFFRKLFIYLGQYRDRIPDGLLAKIYQFAIRNS